MVDAATRFQEAVGLVESGALAEADAICLEILNQSPIDSQAMFLRGLIAFQQSEIDRAIALIRSASENDPNNPTYLATLGAMLINVGDAPEAIIALEHALALNVDDVVSLRYLARLYRQVGRVSDAIVALERLALREPPEPTDLHALGNLLQAVREPDAAVMIFERVVAMAPEDVLARNLLAACQQMRGRVGQAIESYRSSLSIQAEGNPAAVGLLAAMQTICDWRGLTELSTQADAMTEASVKGSARPVEDPFLSVTRTPDTGRNYDVARLWSVELADRVKAWRTGFRHEPHDRDNIRIGYLSSDFHDHATSHLMLGLFGAHDRSRFSIHAYSCGPDDGSDYRRRVKADCDAFVDLSEMDSIAAAQRIHDDEVDILVDLKGYTRQNRLEIAAQRPAPLQVSWLGFPGTSGADFFDYIVTDDVVTPPDAADAYSEAFVVMPHGYQVNNRGQEIAEAPITRGEAGLPEDAFVFASFNNTYKLEPVMFAVWMDILRDVPNSVLWLLPNNSLAIDNLRREALAADVAPERLIFAEMLPKAEHLKRAGLADLALDTRIYNGHTTTSDMLWAGVPVVTLKGSHFASRVSASLLQAFGLPELIVETREDYRALARNFAQSPARCAALREEVQKLRQLSPLFDTKQFAQDLERAYAEMWRRYNANEAPQRLVVSDINSAGVGD